MRVLMITLTMVMLAVQSPAAGYLAIVGPRHLRFAPLPAPVPPPSALPPLPGMEPEVTPESNPDDNAASQTEPADTQPAEPPSQQEGPDLLKAESSPPAPPSDGTLGTAGTEGMRWTPQMLLRYFQSPAPGTPGTNSITGVEVPLIFTPPVPTSRPSSEAHYEQK